MQNFRVLGALPPDPHASGGWGFCPETPRAPLASSGWGSAPRPPKQPPHCEFLATRLPVARIFGWGAPKHKSHAMTSPEIFKREPFYGARMEDQTPGPGLALKQDFAKERRFE